MPRSKRLSLNVEGSQVRHLASVWDSPLPAGPAQLVLVALIYTGHTCYCYRRQQPGRPWFVYIRDLEEVRGQLNGSVPLDEWARDYAAILATFYSEPVVVDADARLRLSDGQACQ